MRLGVNGWRLRTSTGVARVLLNILRYWSPEFVGDRFDTITVYSPVALDSGLDLPEWIRLRVIGPDLPMLLWENTRLAGAARDDVLLCPSYSRPLWTRARTVSLIYEATQKLFPEYYPRTARYLHTPLYGWSARHSTLVVTNTEHARSDIVAAYGAPPQSVRVVALAPADVFHNGHSPERISEVRNKYARGSERYFLYVGKLTARRNIPRMIEALAELKRNTAFSHKLVLVGLNTTNIDLTRLAASLGVSDDVVHHAFVPDGDLAALYSGAEAFILPYTYESAASLTLLEAQATGVPVITTDTAGLREVAGDAALFLPDVEVSSIASAMAQVANDSSLREALSRDGPRNAALYSWRRCSNEMLDILHEAGSGGH